jgi:hypothetical protein
MGHSHSEEALDIQNFIMARIQLVTVLSNLTTKIKPTGMKDEQSFVVREYKYFRVRLFNLAKINYNFYKMPY